MALNLEFCRFFNRNSLYSSALAVVIGLGTSSCSTKKQAQVPAKSEPQGVEKRAEPQDPAPPIVRLDPPEMLEPNADAPRGDLLRLRLKEGYEEVRVFEGQARIRLAGAEPIMQRIRARVKVEVQQVDGDVYAIRLAPTAITVGEDGRDNQAGLLTKEPALIDVDSRGRVLTPTDAIVNAIQTIGFVPLPEKRVAPGATWSLTGVRTWPLLGEVRVTEEFTYRGVEQQGGRKVHRIEHHVRGSLDSVTTEATYYLDAETGTLRRGEVQIGGSISVPDPGRTTAKAEVSIHLAIRRE